VLVVAEHQSDEWVREQVVELPLIAIAHLHEGPAVGPDLCAICGALQPIEGEVAEKRHLLHEAPATNLLDYHAHLKDGAVVDQDEADEIWTRCLQIYRAAGWDGDL
jgi:hypothetical protein